MPQNNNQQPTNAQIRRVARYSAKIYAEHGTLHLGAQRTAKDLRMSPSKIWACWKELERRGIVCCASRINLDGIPSEDKCHQWSCDNAECVTAYGEQLRAARERLKTSRCKDDASP